MVPRGRFQIRKYKTNKLKLFGCCSFPTRQKGLSKDDYRLLYRRLTIKPTKCFHHLGYQIFGYYLLHIYRVYGSF